MSEPERTVVSPPVHFGPKEWTEEVEAGRTTLKWRRCRAHDAPDGTSLPGCVKLYVPLGSSGSSEAPFGFVFRFQEERDGSFGLGLVAYGERHPDNRGTRTVYERAHKRLHGRYPPKDSGT